MILHTHSPLLLLLPVSLLLQKLFGHKLHLSVLHPLHYDLTSFYHVGVASALLGWTGRILSVVVWKGDILVVLFRVLGLFRSWIGLLRILRRIVICFDWALGDLMAASALLRRRVLHIRLC